MCLVLLVIISQEGTMLEFCTQPLKRVFAIDLPSKDDQITVYLKKHLISLWLAFVTHVVPKSLSFQAESHCSCQLASEERQDWPGVMEGRGGVGRAPRSEEGASLGSAPLSAPGCHREPLQATTLRATARNPGTELLAEYQRGQLLGQGQAPQTVDSPPSPLRVPGSVAPLPVTPKQSQLLHCVPR